MSAMTVSHAGFGRTLASGGWLFWRSANAAVRWEVLGFFLFFLATALFRGSVPSLYPLALGIWWLWVPRIALMHREARLDNTPSITPAVLEALVIACLPVAAAYAWSGNLPTLVTAVFWMAVGMMASLLSLRRFLQWFYGLFGMAAASVALDGLFGWKAKALLRPWLEGLPAMSLSAPAAVIAIALAIWMWRRFVSADTAGGSGFMHRPMVTMSTQTLRSAQASHPYWMGLPLSSWALPRIPDLPATRPAETMPYWIGHLFAPLTRGKQAARAAAFAVFVAFVVGMHMGGGPDNEQMQMFLMLMIVLPATLAMFLQRLHQFMQNPSGELPELALLPGWGGADSAKRALLDAVWIALRREYVAIVVMPMLLATSGLLAGTLSPQQVAGMLLVIVEIALANHVIAVAILGGRRFKGDAADVGALLALCAVPAASLWGLVFQSPSWAALVLASIAVLLCGGVLLREQLKAYRRRPHPFLQP